MKISTLLPLILLFFTTSQLSNANPSPADTSERHRIEEMIWASESAYFTRLYKADYEGVLLLTDSLFLGWPESVGKPVGKPESAVYMKKIIPKPTQCKCTVVRGGITLTSTTAITQYLLRVICPGTEDAMVSRISHTWVKRGNVWRLLGGMSVAVSSK